MKTNSVRNVVGLALLLCATPLLAATPEWVNYQGVLRDAGGNPREGVVDMTFRFFDALEGGNEILVDRHLAAGTGGVFVSHGLFSVPLGSGAVSDGAAVLPGDPYDSLAAVFQGFPGVWMQIEIATGGPTELLTPRVHVEAVPFALKSAWADRATTADDAQLATLALDAISATNATNAVNADFATIAANAGQLDGLPAANYLSTSVLPQTKSGSLTVNGDLTAGGNRLRFGFPGAQVVATDTLLSLSGGDQATDDMHLLANLASSNYGALYMEGQGPISLRAGNGVFNFQNALTGAQLALLDSSGTFAATGNLVANGNSLLFSAAGASLSASPAALSLTAGDIDSDDLIVSAGNEVTDGGLFVNGDGTFWLHSGDGTFRFNNGASGAVTATLAPVGDLSLSGDLTALGNDLRFNFPGARLSATSTALELQAGDADTDNLYLRAGNELTDGAVDITGDGSIVLRAGNGTFTFVNGATSVNTATLGSTGGLNVGQDLIAGRDVIVGGYQVHLGAPGSARLVRNPTNDDVWIARDEDNNHAFSTFSIFTNVGERQLQINDGPDAPAYFDGNVNANGLDYAEAFWISDPSLEAGEVVMFDPKRPGYVARASEAYSTRLAGVISSQPGFVTGGSFDAEETVDPAQAREMKRAFAARDYDTAKEIALVLEQKKKEQQRPVALAGRLPVKVDATYGAIKAGDQLKSSPTPGHAMRMSEAGPSIGVALEDWRDPGTGTILAFVQRGHYTPTSLIIETQEAQQQLSNTLASRTPDPVSGVQVLPSNLQYVLDGAGEQEARFSIFRDGEAAEPRAEVFRVDERGNVWAQGAFRPRSMDVAETFRVSEPVEPGDVLVVDRERAGRYAKGRQAGDPAVVGVVASDPGVILGGDMSRLLGESPELEDALAKTRESNDRQGEAAVWAEVERRFREAHAAVALTGTVLVKVDASYGSIAPGDLLTASPTPGHAMRAPESIPLGAVIGKALEPFDRGAGSIRMLVMLR